MPIYICIFCLSDYYFIADNKDISRNIISDIRLFTCCPCQAAMKLSTLFELCIITRPNSCLASVKG